MKTHPTSFYSLCVAFALIASPAAFADTTDLRDVVHSTNHNIVLNTFGNCVRTKWVGSADECAPAAAPQAVARRVQIGQEERTVYFEFNKYALTAESVEKLNTLAAKLTSDSQVREAKVVGYADRIGTPSYNEQLSKKRAENVRRYLASRGFLKGKVADTRWYGESAPATQCPDNLSREELIQCLQPDRKVQVEIEYVK